MVAEYGPYTFRCMVFGCKWSRWIGGETADKQGRKCSRCGRWQYEDGMTLPGAHNS